MSEQVDELANYLMKHWSHEIGAGDPVHGEGAVDVAIRLLERLRTQETIMAKHRSHWLHKINVGRAEKAWQWIAEQLPRPLIYFAAIRLFAFGTVGKYGDTVVPELTAIEALQRWTNQG